MAEDLTHDDPELAAIVGEASLPRTQVIAKIWAYIKKHGLQDKEQRRMINVDAALRPMFKKDQVTIFDLAKVINQNLTEEKAPRAKTKKRASAGRSK